MISDLMTNPEPGTMRNHPGPLVIRVMLVDDQPVMRVGLANVLSLNHGFVVAAVAIGFERGILKLASRS